MVYSEGEIRAIADLAERYGATVIVDQLYSRLRYQGTTYTHLRAADIDPNRVLTIDEAHPRRNRSADTGSASPSASPRIVERMERLQAIVSLRAAGYNQSVLATWLAEPNDRMAERIALHQAIRNDLLAKLKTVDGMAVRTPEAGSYLFPKLPPLSIDIADFIKALRFQASVVATPGSEFGPDSGSFVRLNFSQKHAEAIAAVDRMTTLIKRYGN